MKNSIISDEIRKFETRIATGGIRRSTQGLNVILNLSTVVEDLGDRPRITPVEFAIYYVLAEYLAELQPLDKNEDEEEGTGMTRKEEAEILFKELQTSLLENWVDARVFIINMTDEMIETVVGKDPANFTKDWPNFPGLGLIRACKDREYELVVEEATRRKKRKNLAGKKQNMAPAAQLTLRPEMITRGDVSDFFKRRTLNSISLARGMKRLMYKTIVVQEDPYAETPLSFEVDPGESKVTLKYAPGARMAPERARMIDIMNIITSQHGSR